MESISSYTDPELKSVLKKMEEIVGRGFVKMFKEIVAETEGQILPHIVLPVILRNLEVFWEAMEESFPNLASDAKEMANGLCEKIIILN